MNVVALDYPLLIVGLASLLFLRFRGTLQQFQFAAQIVGTFWAQISLGVSWSLSRIVPFLAASRPGARALPSSHRYIPYLIYTVLGSVVMAQTWYIPAGTPFAYGQGRLPIQLAVFASLVLCARGLAVAISEPGGPQMLMKALTLVALVHGSAFIYQYFASYLDLPLLGISRAQDLTLLEGRADIAAFQIAPGLDLLRPGGLAGEPKTVACIFGVVVSTYAACGNPFPKGSHWRTAAFAGVLLSLFGFIAAFSTSAYVGFVFSIVLLALFGLMRPIAGFGFAIGGLVLLGIAAVVLRAALDISLGDLLSERFSERLASGQMDLPIEVAFEILSERTLLLFFGSGLGGATFFIQERLNLPFDFALTPNVQIVALLFESGIIGLLLFMVPFFTSFLASKGTSQQGDERARLEIKLVRAVSLSTMAYMLTSSGFALGFPLAIGCAIAAVERVRQGHANRRGGRGGPLAPRSGLR